MTYAFNKFDKEKMARANGSNLSISLKKSVELAKAIQGKRVDSAINYLERVIEKKQPVPYTRFKQEMAHKKGKGIAVGGYPVNVAKEFLKLINSAKKNASEQEVSGDLYIVSFSARQGPSRYRPGRHQGRKMKMSNVEVVLAVREKKKTTKKEEKKIEIQNEEKKAQ